MALFSFHKGYNRSGHMETVVEIGWFGLAILGAAIIALFLR